MKSSVNQVETGLQDLYDSVAEGCVECGLCQKDCLFLQKYGSPKQIADRRSSHTEDLRTSFECSLCWLCTAVCPKKIDPAAMFASMRRLANVTGHGTFTEHNTILRYERWGMSPAISWYGLPGGCDTVLFPGCAMAGTRSARIIDLYNHLKRTAPALGIVLDCCTKPSHDLGRTDFFSERFGALRDSLVVEGVNKVLVACPSCYRVWKDYGRPIEVTSIYEELLATGPINSITSSVAVRVHDPCPTRYDSSIHKAVRTLLKTMEFSLQEMKHHGKKTLCCGEGGAACYLVPNFADNWTETRAKESEAENLVTYCAGCTNFLSRQAKVSHVVDLFFEPEKTLAGQIQITRSPITWFKRLLLKRKLQKIIMVKVSGNRTNKGKVDLIRKE